MPKREVTVKQFIDAIRQNGYKQGTNSYIVYENPLDKSSPVMYACAIGQAGLNLGVNPDELHDHFIGLPNNSVPDIVMMNDYHHLSLSQIATTIENWAKGNGMYDESLGEIQGIHD